MTSTNSPSATCNVVAAACPASNSSTLAAFVTSSKSPRHNAPVVAGPLHGNGLLQLSDRLDDSEIVVDVVHAVAAPSHQNDDVRAHLR